MSKSDKAEVRYDGAKLPKAQIRPDCLRVFNNNCNLEQKIGEIFIFY